MFRGRLAEQLDCLMQCECSEEQVACQVMLDTILYDLDRAIDLYAVGVDEFGEPERRTAAYGVVLDQVRVFLNAVKCLPIPGPGIPQSPAQQTLNTTLDQIALTLRPILPSIAAEVLALRTFVTDSQWPSGIPSKLSDFMNGDVNIINFIIAVYNELPKLDFENPKQPSAPAFIEPTFDVISQELCIHKDAESRWENLVRTMAPDCRGIQNVFDSMEAIINKAIKAVGGICDQFEPSLPPHFETSLDSIADDVDRDGDGRPKFVPLGRKR
jgi:hypothetical protein